MSETDNQIPPDISPEELTQGLLKFIIIVEEEIEIHHLNPQWMDLDKRCREEQNLIVRAKLVLDILNEAVQMFKLPANHELMNRINTAEDYFNKL